MTALVIMYGRTERYDARQFLRALFFELAAPGSSHMIVDLDIDVSAATVQGFNGEIAHDVRIRFSERQREILEFLFVGKIGQGAFKAEIRNSAGFESGFLPLVFAVTSRMNVLLFYCNGVG